VGGGGGGGGGGAGARVAGELVEVGVAREAVEATAPVVVAVPEVAGDQEEAVRAVAQGVAVA